MLRDDSVVSDLKCRIVYNVAVGGKHLWQVTEVLPPCPCLFQM